MEKKTSFAVKPIVRRIIAAAAIAVGCGVVAACMNNDGDDIDFAQFNDLYVTGISFGTLQRDIHTLDKQGNDSVYRGTLAATTRYPLSIDHLRNLIYNADSLPAGVDATKIVFSNFKISQGYFSIEMLNKIDGVTGEPLDTAYATTDSLDFSTGARRFRLYGQDGTSRRTYTVDVRIHRQAEDSLTWREHPAALWDEKAPFAAAGGRSFSAAGQHFTLGNGTISRGEGADAVPDDIEADNANSLPDDNLSWAELPTSLGEDVRQVILYGTQQRDTLESRVWRKIIDTTGKRQYKWEYLVNTVENRYPAPPLRHAALFRYDGGLLLCGIDSRGYIRLKYSDDGGRIWQNHVYMQLPKALKTYRATSLAAAMDDDGNLWLLVDGRSLWYGRAHSVGWKEDQKVFLKSRKR